MIVLKPNWEAELVKQHKKENYQALCGRDEHTQAVATQIRRTLKSRIKELHKLISTGQARIEGKNDS